MHKPTHKFWGVEVRPRERYAVHPTETRVLHLSQACLGEVVERAKKERVAVIATVDGQSFPIGILSDEKVQQISYDLVFDKDFELSHSSFFRSVYFTGYMSSLIDVKEHPYDRPGVEGYPFAIKDRGLVGKPYNSDSDDSDSDDPDSDDPDKGATPDEVEPTPAPMEMDKGASDDGGDSPDEVEPTPTPMANKSPAEAAPGAEKAILETPQKSTVSFLCSSCNKAFGSVSALRAHCKEKHNM